MHAFALAGALFLTRVATGQTDAGAGCGNVTAQGSCTGEVATYCDTQLQIVRTIDCPMQYTATTHCVQLDQTSDFRCAEATGKSCLSVQGTTRVTLACQGHSPGCVETIEHALCTEGIGPCMLQEVGTCNGDRLLLHCDERQPYYVDCASYGGMCANRACVNIPNLHPCDDQALKCASGLRCFMSVCIPATFGQDAGAGGTSDSGGEPDAGGTGGTPDSGASSGGSGKSGCSCVGTSPRPPERIAWPVLGFLVMIEGVVRVHRNRNARRARVAGP